MNPCLQQQKFLRVCIIATIVKALTLITMVESIVGCIQQVACFMMGISLVVTLQ